MSAEQMTSLMQRKARTGREAYAERAMTLGRAMRLTAAKQAEHLMGMAMNVLGMTRRTITGSQIKETVDGASLMLLMDGPANQVGAAVLEPALVAGLIQQQTMGKITPPAQDAAQRNCTATDAALCAPFVVALMTHAAQLAEEPEDQSLLEGYRFGVWAPEVRQTQMALDQFEYEMIEVTLDLAGGARLGKLCLILPSAQQTSVEEAQEDSSDVVSPSPVTLSENVFGLNAEIMVALTRVSMPLQHVSDFKVGDVIDIDVKSMARTLVIDANGRVISRGTLGQIDGMRAVQVEHGRAKERTQPRRRASDREALDLPDVTLQAAPALSADVPEENAFLEDQANTGLPSLSDMSVFGEISDLNDLPDIEDAAEAADAKMAEYDGLGEGQDRRTESG